MKTDKFEKTIRQKLESISPDFHESDWAKMQNYMQVHTPPTFWQQYGSWLGYAAAASVSTVMAFLYVNQLSQNNKLVTDVKQLQSQIEVINHAPAVTVKTDTVYIMQKEFAQSAPFNNPGGNGSVDPTNSDASNSGSSKQTSEKRQLSVRTKDGLAKNEGLISPKSNEDLANGSKSQEKNTSGFVDLPDAINREPFDRVAMSQRSLKKDNVYAPTKGQTSSSENFVNVTNGTREENNSTYSGNATGGDIGNSNGSDLPPASSAIFAKTLDGSFSGISEIQSLQLSDSKREMNYALANRLSSKQVRKLWIAAVTPPVKPVIGDKKVEQATKADNVIPKLNLKVPYRFGAAMQFEGRNVSKTVLGEVLVAKKFSISAGVSWLRIKPMEFFTETIFREKNRKDFKKTHPNQVPMAVQVLNINVKPTLVQIPLTVALRNEIKHDFSYFVSAGTNISIKGREQYSFDCKLPNPAGYPTYDYFRQTFERKMDVPLVNSINFSAGIEKSWHPIVVQVEGYMFNYFKPLSPDSPRSGPGVKLKLMYQIGRKM